MEKLLFQPQHRILAKRIACDVFDEYQDPTIVICIGGKSGVGKTEVALLTKEFLTNKHTKVLSLDNFYVANHEQTRKKTLDFVGRDEIDWHRLWRAVNNTKHSHAYDVIIVEGLYALYFIEFDTGYYISQSYEDSYQFRLDRGKEDPDCMFRQKVLDLEAIDVRNSKERADVVLTYE